MRQKTKLGRRSSRKTVANQLVKKKPRNTEHQQALDILEKAIKHFDNCMHKVARCGAQLTAAQQKHKAVSANGHRKEQKTKIKNVLVTATQRSQLAKSMFRDADQALVKLIKYVADVEKKHHAREKALADFLFQWEMDYNKRHGLDTPDAVLKQALSGKFTKRN